MPIHSRSRLGFVPLAIAFVGLTMWLARALNIWQDEWYSLRTTSRDLGFAWTTALQFEGIPPLYPLVLVLWRQLDGSAFFARAFSIACVALATWIAWRFAERELPRVPPAAFAAAFAFNPFSIFAAIEIRLYAMALLFSMAIVALFFRAFGEPQASARVRFAFVVVAIVGIYVQYFNAALVLGGFAALIFAGRARTLRAYAVAVVAIALACSPIALFIGQQIEAPRSLDAHRLDLAALVETAVSFALPHGALVNWFSDRRNVLYDLGGLAVVAAIVVARPRATHVVRGALGFIVTALAFYPAATIVLHQTFVYPRHAAILVVPMVLLIFALVDGATQRRALALGSYGFVYALCTLAALVVTYRDLAKPGDFARAATFLRAHDREATRVFAFDQEMVGPLGYYYTRARPIEPLPEAQRFDRFDASQFRFTSTTDVRSRLASVSPGARILLYRGDICYDPADQYGCRFLEEVVRHDFRTLARQELRSANVRELVRR